MWLYLSWDVCHHTSEALLYFGKLVGVVDSKAGPMQATLRHRQCHVSHKTSVALPFYGKLVGVVDSKQIQCRLHYGIESSMFRTLIYQ